MNKKIFFLFLLICITLVPFTSLADNTVTESVINEPVDLSAKCSINLEFKHKDIVFENEPVELYKIADISTNYIFSLTEEFEGTGVVLNGGITKGEWNTIRSTIESYIVSENILPLDVAFTDEDGHITFDDLEPGMYFTSSIHTARNDVGYRFASVLSSLPNLKDGSPVYDVEVNTKPDRDNPPGRKIKYRVSKLWKDEEFEQSRPEEISVKIFKNGVLHETVVLNETNNWFYSWEADDDGSDWMIAEEIDSDDYIVLVEKRERTFVLINQHKKITPPDDSSKPDEPAESTDVPSDNDAPTGDSTNFATYIIVMSLAGVALVILSIIGNKALDKEENK